MESDTSDNKTDKPWLWKKGVSPNPKGRPPGIKSLKMYVKERLLSMTDEEKDEYLDALPKAMVWQMAEGNPDNKVEAKIDNTNAYTEAELKIAHDIIVERLRKNTGSIEDSGGTDIKQ